jgi:hypothetical protein
MLRRWLKANGIKAINRLHPVVVIPTTSSVDRRKLSSDTHVVKADNLLEWWKKQADAIGIGTAVSMVGRFLISGMSPEDLVTLGERLSQAHVPPTYDWRAILRLPREISADTPPSDQPTSAPVVERDVSKDAPQVIATAHGEISLTRIPDGRYALRNDKNDALIEIVKSACKGRAQWNPRFRNWLISESELPGIWAEVNHKVSSLPPTAG